MPLKLDELLERPESETFDRKSALDPTFQQDYLELAADLVAMANTEGGSILIGSKSVQLTAGHLPLFDSARIDDKVNSLVEPRIGGIKSHILGQDFVLVEVDKSENPPHIFRQDGNCTNRQHKPASVFRKGDVYVRHSSKSERATRTDFDRWLEARQRRLFDNVKLVFQASPEAEIRVVESASAMPVRIDPGAAYAQPVYEILTADPFRNLEQELTGAVKAWKTSGQFLNEVQIYKAYNDRVKILSAELTELVLISCWNDHMQGYFWASKLSAHRLTTVLEAVVSSTAYPASLEALKVASLIPREHAKVIFEIANASSKKSMKRIVKKLEPVLRARAKKSEALVHVLTPGQNLSYKVGEGTKEVKLDAVGQNTFDELLNTLIAGQRENRSAFKSAELLLFGASVTQVDFSTMNPKLDLGETVVPESDGITTPQGE